MYTPTHSFVHSFYEGDLTDLVKKSLCTNVIQTCNQTVNSPVFEPLGHRTPCYWFLPVQYSNHLTNPLLHVYLFEPLGHRTPCYWFLPFVHVPASLCNVHVQASLILYWLECTCTIQSFNNTCTCMFMYVYIL